MFSGIFLVLVLYLQTFPVLSIIELVNSKPSQNYDNKVLGEDKTSTLLYLPSSLALSRVGEEVRFEVKKDLYMTGTIARVRTYGEHSFTWFGSLLNGGSFHLSYSEGAILATIDGAYGYQYELRPQNLADNLYVVEEVALSKYDKMESPNDAVRMPDSSGDYKMA
jgi:hypothetical protein